MCVLICCVLLKTFKEFHYRMKYWAKIQTFLNTNSVCSLKRNTAEIFKQFPTTQLASPRHINTYHSAQRIGRHLMQWTPIFLPFFRENRWIINCCVFDWSRFGTEWKVMQPIIIQSETMIFFFSYKGLFHVGETLSHLTIHWNVGRILVSFFHQFDSHKLTLKSATCKHYSLSYTSPKKVERPIIIKYTNHSTVSNALFTSFE